MRRRHQQTGGALWVHLVPTMGQEVRRSEVLAKIVDIRASVDRQVQMKATVLPGTSGMSLGLRNEL